ncbi:MAG: hypothetical protein GY765_20830 [bacterium]|nr:hypothetical protein [bacterium]
MQAVNENSKRDADNSVEIVTFSNQSRQDKKLLKEFVAFPWKHYENEPQYIPLFDFEYLGFRTIGVVGFFEPRNLFFKHADMVFFLAKRNGETVGRCNSFVNHAHNDRWEDKVGFFGHFESIEDPAVSEALLEAAARWLKGKGMDTIRGPQNMPVNEATPGIMTDGFDSRPVIYYHYNKKFYQKLLLDAGFNAGIKVFSWEVPIMRPMEEKLQRVANKVIDRYSVTIENWNERPYKVRKAEMLEIYNDAWNDNYGFTPFTKEEFDVIIDGMQLIFDKRLFNFLYVKGEPAAFLGGVPNIMEKMAPEGITRKLELMRVLKVFFTKGGLDGFRLGYLGVKKKFQRFGLDGILIWHQKEVTQKIGLKYCDLGWVLEDNIKTVRLADLMGAELSKTYTIFEKKI